MNKKAFTLIELLSVIVILAIIALIAIPIILDIIKDSKEESNKRSIEGYAKAVENAVLKYQIANSNEIVSGIFTSDETGKKLSNDSIELTVDYDGDVACNIIEFYDDGNFYFDECKIINNNKEYTYGKEQKPSFANDSWSKIIKTVQSGNQEKIQQYKVGETKTIELTSNDDKDGNADGITTGEYTVRLANNSTPDECNTEGFSQTACGFVIEFVDVITKHQMNSTHTNAGQWKASTLRKYLTPIEGESGSGVIYNTLPEEIRNNIINTNVTSSSSISTTDKLYLLSKKEVYNDASSDIASPSKTRQIDYYKDKGVTTTKNYSAAIKKNNGNAETWWLRSADMRNSRGFFIVQESGQYSYPGAGGLKGVAPAFRLGRIE